MDACKVEEMDSKNYDNFLRHVMKDFTSRVLAMQEDMERDLKGTDIEAEDKN